MVAINLKTRIKLKKVLITMVCWLAIGLVVSLYDELLLRSDYSSGSSDMYSFSGNLGFNLMAAFFGSMLGGIFLVFFVEEKLRDRSYGFNILAVAITFILIVVLVTLVLGAIFVPGYTGQPLTHPDTQVAFVDYLTKNRLHLKNIIVWSIAVSITQLMLQISNKFGPGILWAFITGKYRSPRRESRIFMFADLRSSTAIAERLGNERYHELLKDFFSDITNAILYNKGQIYQYVGDEVVISWPTQHGVENAHALRCYFDMQDIIRDRAGQYQQAYGLVPQFKAGLHYGEVLAGEIGIIKRDVTYSGDVLNTSARIQSKCNELGTQLLISEELLKLMTPPKPYQSRSLGNIELKGKQEKLNLHTLVDLRIKSCG